MPEYTVYSTLSGEITRVMDVPDDDAAFANLYENNGFIKQNSNVYTDMVDLSTNTIVSRLNPVATINKTNFLANGEDSVIISNLVKGIYYVYRVANVEEYVEFIPGEIFVPNKSIVSAAEGDVETREFKTKTPGTYEMVVTGFPYLPSVFLVTATTV